MINDQHQYTAMRSELLKVPTNVEHQVLSRIATIERHHQDTIDTTKSKWDRSLTVHYHHEQRLATFKKDLHQLWTEIFNQTPIHDVRLIVGHRNNRNTKRELIHNRPQGPQTK
jgi:predicted transcriptional regulator